MESSCLAELDPLPPSFTCANEMHGVPYTVVCDHRVDCADRSDEDFCVFPPCHATLSYDCGNGQVGRGCSRALVLPV